MRVVLRGIVFIAALIVNSGSAYAASKGSADRVMPGCRAWLEVSKQTPTVIEAAEQGICFGVIQGLVYATPHICPPDDYTFGLSMRVVVHYIDSRPARLHEDFMALALEAIRAAWPCKQ